MMRDTEYYRLRAEESRAIQDLIVDIRNKNLLQKVIDDYEVMANMIEEMAQWKKP